MANQASETLETLRVSKVSEDRLTLFYQKALCWLFIIAFSIYWVGVFGVTFLGNIPLNRMLDQTNLESIALEDAKALRNVKWNNLNLIRTISSGISFLLLILSFTFID